jgi:uncharacterized protein
MRLPPFEPDIGEDARKEIAAHLTKIENDHGIRILFAIESGSRAWGFPSPDSDYDVRFVYAHPADWYLSLTPGRDVIEQPILDDFDVGGWELRKALNLLIKPNPVLLEWLSSPIRYIWDEDAASRLLALSRKTAYSTACIQHYLHLGEGQWRRYVGDGAKVNYKKYFYVLRPALAIRWVRLNPDEAPPMNIQDLSNRLDLSAEEIDSIHRLLELKSKSKEVGDGDRIPELDSLIKAEFDWARTEPPRTEKRQIHEEADSVFRMIVKGHI